MAHYTERTLYRIYARNEDSDRVVMHSTDMNGMYMDRFDDFGAMSVFDVAKVLDVYDDVRPEIKSVSKTEFKRIFGKAFVL
jgi:hypothetical protein